MLAPLLRAQRCALPGQNKPFVKPPAPSRLLPGAGEHKAARLHNAGAPPARRGIPNPTLRLSSHVGGMGRRDPPAEQGHAGDGGGLLTAPCPGAGGFVPLSWAGDAPGREAGGTQAIQGPLQSHTPGLGQRWLRKSGYLRKGQF